MMNILNRIYKSKLLYLMLGVSLLYFLIKGFKYLLIGSYLPILFILIIVIMLYWSFTLNLKSHYKMLRFWAIILIFWALVRFSLWLIFKIDVKLTESHMREQFGIFQHIISIMILVIGIGIIKQIKSKKSAGNNVYN